MPGESPLSDPPAPSQLASTEERAEKAYSPPEVILSSERVAQASKNLIQFMSILKTRHVGYGPALNTIPLALLTKEPIVILGPGGNGKSFLSGISRYIIDEETGQPDFIRRNFGPDTNKAEMVGPLSPTALQQQRYERLASASMANHYGVQIDELFDASPNVVRSFHEIYDQEDRRTTLLIATTNKTIERLLLMAENRYDDRTLPRPTLGRFPLKVIVPRDFAQATQYIHMFYGVDEGGVSPREAGLTWQQVWTLLKLSRQVTIPLHVDAFLIALGLRLKDAFLSKEIGELTEYRRQQRLKGLKDEDHQPPFVAGTEMVKRAFVQSRKFLRAASILRLAQNLDDLTKADLSTTVADVDALLNLAPVIAAEPKDVPNLIAREIDPDERVQLQNAFDQWDALKTVQQELIKEANEEYTKSEWGSGFDFVLTKEHFPHILQVAMKRNLIEMLKTTLSGPGFSGEDVARLKIASELLEVGSPLSLTSDKVQFLEELRKVVAAFKDQTRFKKLAQQP